MADATARRSFHGPFHTPLPRRPGDPLPSRPLERARSASKPARTRERAVLRAAGDEAPPTNERERVLANVLSALLHLTTLNR